MSGVIVNGTALKSMIHNGQEVQKWIHDGIEIFSSKKIVISGGRLLLPECITSTNCITCRSSSDSNSLLAYGADGIGGSNAGDSHDRFSCYFTISSDYIGRTARITSYFFGSNRYGGKDATYTLGSTNITPMSQNCANGSYQITKDVVLTANGRTCNMRGDVENGSDSAGWAITSGGILSLIIM